MTHPIIQLQDAIYEFIDSFPTLMDVFFFRILPILIAGILMFFLIILITESSSLIPNNFMINESINISLQQYVK